MSPASIGIGLLGLGVVGTGVARALTDKAETIARRVGAPVELRGILVRDLRKERALVPAPLTTDVSDVLDDPRVDIVVEVMGNEQPAHEYILRAIARGKHVVTANKEVMAKHGPEIVAEAARRGVDVAYEASVGGGIPVIGPFKLDLLANDITRVTAIINGTTNYILTQMASGQQTFEAALGEAQALGYAEPDPTNDVEGIDAAYKLAILCSLAFRAPVHPGQVYCEGITRLSPSDFRYARELGYTLKLLAIGKLVDEQIEARVHPTLVPSTSILASVDGVFNAVRVEGDLVGQVLFHGRGAGASPTSSAIVADVIDLSQRVAAGQRVIPILPYDSGRTVRPMDQLETRYYIRLVAMDRPGVMAAITRVLGELQISLASVVQKEDVTLGGESRYAEIVLTTHIAREAAIQQAVHQIAALPVVQSVGSLIRVED
jgi:homoserine dehydrogenase